MTYSPKPKQKITINHESFGFSEHPSAPGILYAQEGRRAVVYQLIGEQGDLQALKVFKPRYVEPRMVSVAETLKPFATLPGLRACNRTVLTSSRNTELIAENPELAYAILMPWIEGQTWQEIVLSKRVLSPEDSLKIARSLAVALVGMEERGLAHCDLSGPNLIISSDNDANLVDLEEMFGSGFLQPELLPAGSSGYCHKSATNGLWKPQADRFAGAVLLAEILGWCVESVQIARWGESYFDPREMQTKCSRFNGLHRVLRDLWEERIVELLDRAWRSDSLADCPTFAEWNVALLSAKPKIDEKNIHESKDVIPLSIIGPEIIGDDEAPGIDIEHKNKESQPDAEQTIKWICPHCQKEALGERDLCPYCERGRDEPVDQNGKKSKPNWKVWLLIPVMIMFFFLLVMLLRNCVPPPVPPTPSPTYTHQPVDPTTISDTPTITYTPTYTPSPTNTISPTPTWTPSVTPSSSQTPLPTITYTMTPTGVCVNKCLKVINVRLQRKDNNTGRISFQVVDENNQGVPDVKVFLSYYRAPYENSISIPVVRTDNYGNGNTNVQFVNYYKYLHLYIKNLLKEGYKFNLDSNKLFTLSY